MNKLRYEKFEKEVMFLNKKFKEAYDKEDFSEALEIAGTLDQKLYEEGLDLLRLGKNK